MHSLGTLKHACPETGDMILEVLEWKEATLGLSSTHP
jgi:hypothetical protein